MLYQVSLPSMVFACVMVTGQDQDHGTIDVIDWKKLVLDKMELCEVSLNCSK